ncbi:putative ribonuclease H protein [Vitis vinifera]|uniref:Putative ribonuclease H protein n=1 Tax=Vitis vinifera TaxID=29760 RepID=A0A438HGL6_VITVI|nr:putative ribonuclease H protein [Vitis vinifera]
MFEALTNLIKDKVLGSDGFTMAFWLFGWDVVKIEIMGFYREFHERRRFVKSLNATFLVLVPKKGGVEDLKDFKPISLVGSLYKLLAKVLANRIKKAYLRLRVNLDKSELIPVGRVNNIKDLALELGCKVGGLPSCYLGLPLRAPFKSEVVWNSVEERKVRLRLEKIQRDFLWEGGALEQRPHLVRWNLVCLERKKCGLGVRNLALMNKALFSKWNWRFAIESEALWKQAISQKYEVEDGGWCTRAISGMHGVGLWKVIRNEWLGMNSSLAYRVDAWVSDVWNPDGVGDGWTPLFSRALND